MQAEDIVNSRLMPDPPENRADYVPYDVYRKLKRKDKLEMQKRIQQNTVKFAAGLDEKVLPLMPNTKYSTVRGKRNFLGIYAERQAKLQEQIDWLRSEQERNRRLQEG